MVETPYKPIHISKNQLYRMKANITKCAQFHLLVNICHRDYSRQAILAIKSTKLYWKNGQYGKPGLHIDMAPIDVGNDEHLK